MAQECEELFSQRLMLYFFDTGSAEWKERGLGEARLLKRRCNGKVRFVMCTVSRSGRSSLTSLSLLRRTACWNPSVVMAWGRKWLASVLSGGNTDARPLRPQVGVHEACPALQGCGSGGAGAGQGRWTLATCVRAVCVSCTSASCSLENSLAVYVRWKTLDALTPVHNPGSCGSSGTLFTTGALHGARGTMENLWPHPRAGRC